MKNYLKVSVIAALAFSMGHNASAQVTVLEENFSTGYTADSALTDQNGWTQSGTVVTDNYWIEDDLLRVYNDTVGNQFLYKEIPLQTGIVTLSWDWQYEGDGVIQANTGIGLMDLGNVNVDAGTIDETIDYSELSALIRMADGSSGTTLDIRYGDLNGGVDFRTAVPVAYLDGAKINVRMVIDVANQKYDVFAMRESEEEVQMADDYPFRRGVSAANQGLNALVIFDNMTNAAGPMVTVDNIKITASAATEVMNWTLMD